MLDPAGKDARRDPEYREFLKRLAAEGAIEAFNQLVHFDLKTKEGQEKMRSTMAFADQTRIRCERAKDNLIITGGGLLFLVLLYASWTPIGEAFKIIISR